jgi:hypothetical protein
VLLKLVIFQNFPPDNIFNDVFINETAFTFPVELAEGLPINVDSTHYTLELETGTYNYLSIAQQYGTDVFNDWRSVGQFNTTPGDSFPDAVTVIQDSLLTNINIFVDFNNLPIQPF